MSSANVRFEEVPVEVNRNCEVFIPPEPPPSRFKLNHLSNDPSQDYFADGMTDELITGPGQISALRVISCTLIMQYKGACKSLPQIARELNVDVVVEGTLLRAGQKVRISAQLIRADADVEWDWQPAEREFKRAIELNPRLRNRSSLVCLALERTGAAQ
jgi:TolB-like protein